MNFFDTIASLSMKEQSNILRELEEKKSTTALNAVIATINKDKK